MLQVGLTRLFGSKKTVFTATGLKSSEEKVAHLQFLRKLIEAGKINSEIDRQYPLEDIAEAHRYVDTSQKKGNVVINVEE